MSFCYKTKVVVVMIELLDVIWRTNLYDVVVDVVCVTYIDGWFVSVVLGGFSC
jgi:hypothetical protein